MYSSSSWYYGINSLTIYTLDRRNIILQPGAGNVGIGLANPQAQLHVAGSILSNATITANVAKANRFCIGTNCIDQWPTQLPQYWLLSGNNLYTSSTNWNVGIGTNNPQAKLEVNGVIRLTPQTSTPTPVIGGMYYNQNDKTFYCGLPDRYGNLTWQLCGGGVATSSPPQSQELIIPVKIWSDQNKTRLVLEITEE